VDANDRIIQGADSNRKNQDNETEVKQMSQDSNSQMDANSTLPIQSIARAPQDLCNQFYAEKSVALVECYQILRAKLPAVYDVCVCDVRYAVVPGPALCVLTFEYVDRKEVLPHIPRDLLELPLHVCCTSSMDDDNDENVEDLAKHWVACLEAWQGIQDQVPLLLSNPNISGVSFSADVAGPLILLFCLPRGYSVYGAPLVPGKVHDWSVKRCHVTLKPCARMANKYAYSQRMERHTEKFTIGGYIRRDSDGAVFGVGCGHGQCGNLQVFAECRENPDRAFVVSKEIGRVERIFLGNATKEGKDATFTPAKDMKMVEPSFDMPDAKQYQNLYGLDFSLIRVKNGGTEQELDGLEPYKLDFCGLLPSGAFPRVVMRNEMFAEVSGELRPLHTRFVEENISHSLYYVDENNISKWCPAGKTFPVLFNQTLLPRRSYKLQRGQTEILTGGCSGSWVVLADNEKCAVGSFIRSDNDCKWSVVCPLLPFLEHLESNPEHGECTLLLSSPNTSPANCKYL
jgi:hypothetical protein